MVAGDGPERARLQEGSPRRVTFLGQVGGDEVRTLLSSARALLVPSTWYEGQPRVILEAFSAGVPVLASRIGGLPELVEDGVNGLLVEVDDVGGWQDAMERAADDDESVRLGEGAFATWQRSYTPEIALHGLEAAYAAARERWV